MSYTKVVNTKYANIGNVTISFDDGYEVTHSINQIDSSDASSPSVGTYFDENSNRVPTSVTLLGSTWNVSDLPAKVDYPDGQSGTMTDWIIINGHVIFLDEVD
jgi:hypothetical protein